MAIKFPGNTIRLSDTIDQYARRVHINVRNGKVTLVYRWKDHKSTKAHTQRVTLDDTQAGRLMVSVAVAATVAVGEDKTRELLLSKVTAEEAISLAAKAEI